MKSTGTFQEVKDIDPQQALNEGTRAHIDHWVSKFPPERKCLFVFPVIRTRRRSSHRNQIISFKARIDLQQAIKTLAQQPCSDQQHHRRRQFEEYKF